MSNKRVVGWHLAPNNHKCDYCGKIGTTVIVEEKDEYGWSGMGLESCDSCTPPKSCPDQIADVMAKIL